MKTEVTAALPRSIKAHGFSRRKLALLRFFLPNARVAPANPGHPLRQGEAIALWGSAPLPAGMNADTPVLRVEDGFLRSVGLGADLVRPLSWVIDRRGIYFDPTQPSDLEALLSEEAFSNALLERAAALRRDIVAARLTKYNVGRASWCRSCAGNRRVLLVAGQVETDASIALGTHLIRSNIDLLRTVRQAHPDAWLIYKPHPDVRAGLRATGQGEEDAARWCDEVIEDCEMAQLLEQVDEVHVLTSLAGFEALMRERKVVTYGMPFYAGWGLTTDLGLREDVASRRGRPLTLDALVAAALILYPRYVSPRTGQRTTVEQVLKELVEIKSRSRGEPGWWHLITMRPVLAMLARLQGR